MVDLTLEYVMDMKAGRELDALVAEKVMGWHKGESWGGADWLTENNEYVESVFRWNPSEDISKAWLIAEWLGIAVIPQSSETGWRWYACDLEKVSYRGDEIALFPCNDSGISCVTAPEAICKAALLSRLKLQ